MDQIFTVLCSTGMFVAGLLACFLDNTVSGTLQERGMLVWQQQSEHHDDAPHSSQTNKMNTYDFPIGMDFVRKYAFLSKIPLSPTFQGFFPKVNSYRVGRDKSISK